MSSEVRVGIVMGSESDWPTMKKGALILEEFGVGYQVRVLSAHRTPAEAHEWAATASDRGLEVLIAGAGLAAHLPGVMAATTVLPVIGVPVASGAFSGVDALLAIVQMPPGIPVATVGAGRADNAALLALQIMAGADATLRQQMIEYRDRMRERVLAADAKLQGDVAANGART